MTKTMDAWFFMRPGFSTFRLEPEKHQQFLFGTRERQQRDYLMAEIEGASYSTDGHKAVVYGDYGRGKTHMCHNIAFEIERRGMGVIPVYIKCSAYTSKEPFRSLFREMVLNHPTAEVNRVATEYARMHARGEAPALMDSLQSEDLNLVMTRGLTAVDHDAVRNCLRWLGGEAKVDMGLISKALKPTLADSREFGAVLRGLAQMFVTVDRKVPMYFVDEAERFENVSNVDLYNSWLASLREIAEIVDVGLMFFVGAKTRNNLPTIFVQDEIVRRIGAANYVEFQNPSRDQLRDFLIELLATAIRKGEVPAPHRPVVGEAALDTTVPSDLAQITGGDAKRLETYPFEPDAFDEFVEHAAAGDLSNKPSEVLVRLQKAAQRAIRADARVITSKTVDAINTEGF